VVPPDDWLARSIYFLLSTGEVAIGTWGNSVPVCAKWSDLLFLPGSICISLPLQLCLVSSSSSKVV
jgi:hypothetical protein